MRALCKQPGCQSRALKGEHCKLHGGGRRCKKTDCIRSAEAGGLCRGHGGGPRCKEAGCGKSAQQGGKCWSHGGGNRCKAPTCMQRAPKNSYCKKHGTKDVANPPTPHQKKNENDSILEIVDLTTETKSRPISPSGNSARNVDMGQSFTTCRGKGIKRKRWNSPRQDTLAAFSSSEDKVETPSISQNPPRQVDSCELSLYDSTGPERGFGKERAYSVSSALTQASDELNHDAEDDVRTENFNCNQIQMDSNGQEEFSSSKIPKSFSTNLKLHQTSIAKTSSKIPIW